MFTVICVNSAYASCRNKERRKGDFIYAFKAQQSVDYFFFFNKLNDSVVFIVYATNYSYPNRIQ